MSKEGLTVYKVWAPADALWTEWAKPVLFTGMSRGMIDMKKSTTVDVPPPPRWLFGADSSTAVIIDLPGKHGVEEGLALATEGFRPVPLYNGVHGMAGISMLVDVRGISAALFAGVRILEGLNIPPSAPPVFLLDSHRMDDDGRGAGKYDNRWCLFPQDMPSAAFLCAKNIQRVIVYTKEIQSDLTHVLCRYQDAGIKILHGFDDVLKDVTVDKPSGFKSLMYRFKVTMGLKRNPAGGFGGNVPGASWSSSGGGYYGGYYHGYHGGFG